MVDILLCKKSNKKISKHDPKCPAPVGACKYRPNCLIYAFEQIEKMDKRAIKGANENINEKKI